MTPVAAVPVGEVATAARVWVLDAGKPTSDVELNVRADGARVRALRWQQPGLAAIEVLVPTWTPAIDLIIQHRGGAETRTTIPVDPGPPIDATVTSSAARAGRPFAVTARVTTRGGAPVDRARIRVAAEGCVAVADQLTCARPGPVTVVARVEHAGAWVPVAQASVEVAAAPAPSSPAPSSPPRPRPRALGWEVAARGASATDGLWSAGVIAGAVHRVGPRIDVTLGLGWQFGRAQLAPVAPVTDALALSEHQVEVRAGVVVRVVRGAPWAIRIAAGPVAVQQRGVMPDGGWTCTGLRAQALAAVGVRLALGARTLAIDVGARAAVDVRATDWVRSDRQAFVEVGLAGRR